MTEIETTTGCLHDFVRRQATHYRDPKLERWFCRTCPTEFIPVAPSRFRVWRETRRLRRQLDKELKHRW